MANFRMDDRIEFVTCTTVEDEDGIKKEEVEVAYTCWANRLNMSNSEFTKSLEFNTKNYKVRYKNQILNIISALDYKNAHKYVDVKVEVSL